jgi:hypothetical protein
MLCKSGRASERAWSIALLAMATFYVPLRVNKMEKI